MRGHLIILILSLLPVFVIAQIPNNSFEDWINMGTYINPNQWSSMNDITATSGIFTCEQGTPGFAGSYYIKITTRNISGTGMVQGILVSGLLNTTTLQPVSGFQYAGRPEYLKGNWQFMAFSADQGYISVLLTKWNSSLHIHDTVAYANQPLVGMEMSWREFDIPLTYYSILPSDSAIIIASASNAKGSVISEFSFVYLDNLSFTGNVSAVKEVTTENSFVVYPNPVKEVLTVKFKKALTKPALIEILNSLGQQVLSLKIDPFLDSFPVNIGHLPTGIYSLKMTSLEESGSSRFIHIN